MNVLPTWMYVHVWFFQSSEDGIRFLELELGMILSYYMSAGNWTQVSRKEE